MRDAAERSRQVWRDATLAAALFAIAPHRLGGVLVHAEAGPVRDRWLAILQDLMPTSAAFTRVPLNISADRLLGGLDIAATLAAGQQRVEPGVLAQADGGCLVLAMAERWTAQAFGPIASAIDLGVVRLERDGLQMALPARFGVVALAEEIADDEQPPSALTDRLAFPIDLRALSHRDCEGEPHHFEMAAARARFAAIAAPSREIVEALCAAACALGVASLRAAMLVIDAARAHAALAGRASIADEDAQMAGRLVLAPRATRIPAEAQTEEDRDETPQPFEEPENQSESDEDLATGPLEDLVIQAALAALPTGLLATAGQARPPRQGSSAQGRQSGATRKGLKRGRPIGVLAGRPEGQRRLNLVATLQAAAPWQRLRAPVGTPSASISMSGARLRILPDDFRVTRYKVRTEATTIFAVDASGSSALHRLAEAKGAVELLLADCYVRRDKVAVIAFRGRSAELLLPPTRSLARAKRSLATLPGGGGTPLASAIDTAEVLGRAAARRGDTALVVLLTDGQANIGRTGEPDRTKAEADAFDAARVLKLAGLSALLVDTSPRPQAKAQRLAEAMGARYVPLPFADAASMSRAVRSAAVRQRP